ncbi:MAG: ribulose-phosphate 3-epimerase, partial [Candidatus Lokiarchaeota archaeon]
MTKVALAIHAKENFNIEVIKSLEGLDYIHIDVMDGKFVNNTMLYLEIFPQVKDISDLPVIAHLMVETPKDYLSKLKDFVDIFLFHFEITDNKKDLINLIKNQGKKV